jgi:hypothetical protein
MPSNGLGIAEVIRDLTGPAGAKLSFHTGTLCAFEIFLRDVLPGAQRTIS